MMVWTTSSNSFDNLLRGMRNDGIPLLPHVLLHPLLMGVRHLSLLNVDLVEHL